MISITEIKRRKKNKSKNIPEFEYGRGSLKDNTTVYKGRNVYTKYSPIPKTNGEPEI